eukprot:SAG31_NODE_15834_length_736_cov_1.064364_1_plen_58_part_00
MRGLYRCAAEIGGTTTEGTVTAHYCRCHAMQKAIARGMGAFLSAMDAFLCVLNAPPN